MTEQTLSNSTFRNNTFSVFDRQVLGKRVFDVIERPRSGRSSGPSSSHSKSRANSRPMKVTKSAIQTSAAGVPGFSAQFAEFSAEQLPEKGRTWRWLLLLSSLISLS